VPTQIEILSDALWGFHSGKFLHSESESLEVISAQDLWLLMATNDGYRLGALLSLTYLPEELLLELCQIYIDCKIGFIEIENPWALTYKLAESSRIPRYLFYEFDLDDSAIQWRFWENPATPPSIIYRIGEYRKSEMDYQDSIAHIYNPYQMGSYRHTSRDYLDNLTATSIRLRAAMRSDDDIAEFNALFE
jgi:hypothetical protein